MTTTTINGKTYNIVNHIYKVTFAEVLKNHKEYATLFRKLAELTEQKINNKSISVVDIDSGLFYSNISLGNYKRRISYGNKVYNSIITEKGYAESVSVSDFNYSPIYHENIVGHRFVFAIDCPIEYLEDVYLNTVYRFFDFNDKPDGPNDFFRTILEKHNVQNTNKTQTGTGHITPEPILTPEKVTKPITSKISPMDIITSDDYNNPHYPTTCESSIREILQNFKSIRETMGEVEERLINGGTVVNDDITYFSKHVDRAIEAMQDLVWNEIIEEKKITITKGVKEALYERTGLTVDELYKLLGVKVDE